MKNLYYVICILFSFIIFSCGDGNTAGPAKSTPGGDIWPLNTGYSWRWKVSHYNGTVVAYVTYDTLVIGISGDFNGQTWYQLKTGSGINAGGITKNNMGIVINAQDSGLALKYPASVNDSYFWGLTKITVTSINTEVNVPAGKFICYIYKFEWNSGDYGNSYYSPGTGEVMREYYDENDKNEFKLTEKYELEYKNF